MGATAEGGAEALSPSTIIAERFVVEAILGQGGMGAVYRVHDRRSGRMLALKQLRIGAQRSANAAVMTTQFEREYHTLCQLAHPSIIEVYDYGIDGTTAFYTMELLDGQDLRERGRLPWREACAVFRDVASSLAIMHSRRLLHRDISARNVRCTSSGQAKLIDFGAMAPMGFVKHVVGTAPFVPPEALQMQMLDGRSDLYALGALAYWVLTGTYPYPARTLGELPNLWRNVPASPRRYDAQIPEALDQLVMELIELDRKARPISAAEVMERLSGIAGLPRGELPEVSRAYLVAPTLIGRETQLNAVRTQLVAAMQGAGGCGFLIEGAEGTGRSRLLDACVLDAKLLGATVLRADAADASGGEYAVIKTLCTRLFEALPRLSAKCARPWRSVLATLLPELLPSDAYDPELPTSLAPQVTSMSPAISSLPPEVAVGVRHSPLPAAPGSLRPERVSFTPPSPRPAAGVSSPAGSNAVQVAAVGSLPPQGDAGAGSSRRPGPDVDASASLRSALAAGSLPPDLIAGAGASLRSAPPVGALPPGVEAAGASLRSGPAAGSLPPDVAVGAGASLRSNAGAGSLPPVVHTLSPVPKRASVPATESTRSPVAAPGRALQGALRDFVLVVARSKHVVIAVDDFESIDASSAALLGALVNGAKRRRLTVLASVRSDAPVTPALTLLRELAQPISIGPFTLQQSEGLLRAVFGEAGRLATLNERLFALTGGNPRWTMALCERLVERGLARYESGSWRLPIEIGKDDLPHSLAEAYAARIAGLSSDALGLAEALALCEPLNLAVDRYRLLTDHHDATRTYTALECLALAGILRAQGDRYRFATQAWPDALRSRIEPARVAALQLRVAAAHEDCDDPWRVPYHLLLAGEHAQALERMGELRDDPRLYRSKILADTLSIAAAAGERFAYPLTTRLDLQRGVLSFAVGRADYASFVEVAWPLLERFARDSGLRDYAEVDASLPPHARIEEAQRRALQRHHATPEQERGFVPLEAMRLLREVVWNVVGMASAAQELEMVERLPALDPLFAVFPALSVCQLQVDYQRHMQSGRPHLAQQTSLELLGRVERPDLVGLEPAVALSVRHWELHNQGLFAAGRGDPVALEWITEVETQPYIRANARRVRMAYELMHGNVEAASGLRHRAELFALEDGNATILPGTTTRLELVVYSHTDDVIGVKRTMERLELMAQRFAQWRPTWQIARSQYLRITGDGSAALSAIVDALDATAPGRHIDWGLCATLHVALLTTLDRAAEAIELGLGYIAQCERADLLPGRISLLRVVAEAMTRAGRVHDALPLIDEHIAQLLAQRCAGLLLGLAYEARARVAIATHDEAGVRRYAQLCAEQYKGARNPALNTKYRGLMREAETAGLNITTGLQHAVSIEADVVAELGRGTQMADHTLSSRLLGCADRPQRALEALHVLVENAGAAGGYLFDVEADTLRLVARVEEEVPSRELIRLLTAWAPSEVADLDDVATSFEAPAAEVPVASLKFSGRVYEPVVLARDPGLLAVLRYATHERTVLRRELCDAVVAALEEDDHALD